MEIAWAMLAAAATTAGPGAVPMVWPIDGAVAMGGSVIDMEVVVMRGLRVPEVIVIAACESGTCTVPTDTTTAAVGGAAATATA